MGRFREQQYTRQTLHTQGESTQLGRNSGF